MPQDLSADRCACPPGQSYAVGKGPDNCAAMAERRRAMPKPHPTSASELIAQQAAEIARLTAERDALREDAERYRWLRGRLVGADFDWNGDGISVIAFDWPESAAIGADLDAAIDAARK